MQKKPHTEYVYNLQKCTKNIYNIQISFLKILDSNNRKKKRFEASMLIR